MRLSIFKNKLNLIFLLALSIAYLYPWLYMIARSFMSHDPTTDISINSFTLQHYKTVIGNAGFFRYLFNSFIVLTFVLLSNISLSLITGYAFARYKFPFKRLLFVLVLATLMIPRQTLMIPLLDLIVRLGIHNSLLALILPFCLDGFNIFLMKQYIQTLPTELEEAARADGASELEILRQVIYPLSKPAISVLIINTAIINWNSFLFPLIFTDTASVRTLPVALAMLSQGPYATDWGVLMAGAAISSLPLIAIFYFFQKEIISGITSGALKD